jgi:hypothetical protein
VSQSSKSSGAGFTLGELRRQERELSTALRESVLANHGQFVVASRAVTAMGDDLGTLRADAAEIAALLAMHQEMPVDIAAPRQSPHAANRLDAESSSAQDPWNEKGHLSLEPPIERPPAGIAGHLMPWEITRATEEAEVEGGASGAPRDAAGGREGRVLAELDARVVERSWTQAVECLERGRAVARDEAGSGADMEVWSFGALDQALDARADAIVEGLWQDQQQEGIGRGGGSGLWEGADAEQAVQLLLRLGRRENAAALLLSSRTVALTAALEQLLAQNGSEEEAGGKALARRAGNAVWAIVADTAEDARTLLAGPQQAAGLALWAAAAAGTLAAFLAREVLLAGDAADFAATGACLRAARFGMEPLRARGLDCVGAALESALLPPLAAQTRAQLAEVRSRVRAGLQGERWVSERLSLAVLHAQQVGEPREREKAVGESRHTGSVCLTESARRLYTGAHTLVTGLVSSLGEDLTPALAVEVEIELRALATWYGGALLEAAETEVAGEGGFGRPGAVAPTGGNERDARLMVMLGDVEHLSQTLWPLLEHALLGTLPPVARRRAVAGGSVGNAVVGGGPAGSSKDADIEAVDGRASPTAPQVTGRSESGAARGTTPPSMAQQRETVPPVYPCGRMGEGGRECCNLSVAWGTRCRCRRCCSCAACSRRGARGAVAGGGAFQRGGAAAQSDPVGAR